MKKNLRSLLLRLTVLTLLSVLAVHLWPSAVQSSPNTCDLPSFADAQHYNVLQTRPYIVKTSDFNHDGKPDIAVINGDTSISILLGDGLGGLGPPTVYSVSRVGYALAISDFNNDGNFDLAVPGLSSLQEAGIYLLFGNGTGGFGTPQFIAVADGSIALNTGDFNSDGNADLVMIKFAAGIATLLGDGHGGFSAQPTIFTRYGGINSLVVSEFNADGIPDVAVAGGPYVTIFTGTGNGQFNRAPRLTDLGMPVDEPYDVGESLVSIATGYLNNDTEIDLVMASRTSPAGTGDVRVLLGDLGPFFNYNLSYGADDTPVAVAVADFNGDGRDDVAAANEVSDNVSVLLGGAGDYHLFCMGVNTSVKEGTNMAHPDGIAIADFDLDNKPDIVTTNYIWNKATILRNTFGGVSISGRLRDGSGQVLSGVTVTLGGSLSSTTTTDPGGYYTFNNLTAHGNYTVTPSQAARSFKPSSRTYTDLTGFKTGNFIAVVNKPSDFDGDSRADVAVWRPTSGNWNIIHSSDNSSVTVSNWGSGALGDIAVPGDYDADNKTDVAVWRESEGNWYIIRSSTNTGIVQNWGNSGDRPVPADYDGDRRTDFAVFRPSDGNWYIIKSSGGNQVQGWGTSGDKPVPADYDGDGKADVAVFRPSEGNWYIRYSSNNTTSVRGWGAAGDRPVAGDYDGDGKDDIAVFRPSEGNWYIINSSDNSSRVQGWGDSTDRAVPADYDGDGKTDIAVWRPSDGNWYIINSSTGAGVLLSLGLSGDVPVPFAYLPN
jgi:hypothetical protein